MSHVKRPAQTLLTTERLRLVAVVPTHQPFYLKLLALAEVSRYLPLGRSYTADEASAEHLKSVQHWQNGFGTYVIETLEGESIGYVGVETCPNPDYCDIRFALLPSWQSKGIAVEAARGVIKHLFEQCGMERLIGVAVHGNEPSLRLLKKLGFNNDAKATPYGSREGMHTLAITAQSSVS